MALLLVLRLGWNLSLKKNNAKILKRQIYPDAWRHKVTPPWNLLLSSTTNIRKVVFVLPCPSHRHSSASRVLVVSCPLLDLSTAHAHHLIHTRFHCEFCVLDEKHGASRYFPPTSQQLTRLLPPIDVGGLTTLVNIGEGVARTPRRTNCVTGRKPSRSSSIIYWNNFVNYQTQLI